jgi:hypothetical protein
MADTPGVVIGCFLTRLYFTPSASLVSRRTLSLEKIVAGPQSNRVQVISSFRFVGLYLVFKELIAYITRVITEDRRPEPDAEGGIFNPNKLDPI